MRLLGVHAKNAPTKKTLSVTAADFAIGGMIGLFERKFAVPMKINNPSEEIEILGGYVNSNTYGKDVMKTIWDNLAGTRASIYVKSHVGNNGTSIDAVVANKTVNDQGGIPAPTLKFTCAYKGIADYGAQGNRTAFKITNGNRFSTTLSAVALLTDTFIYVTGLMGIKVGDVIRHTAAGPTTVYKKVTAIDESNNKVSLDSALGQAGAVGEAVDVIGFRIQTYRKSITGIVAEVETRLGQLWCTLEPEVSEFYVENVHADNRYMKVANQVSVATPHDKRYPADTANPVYLENGVDGTAPTTAAHWAMNLATFNGIPVRMMANCETISMEVQKAGEVYCKGRSDTPIWIGGLQKNQSKSQLVAWGAQYQRTDENFQVIVAEWLGVNDAYSASESAPDRYIPNCGAVMGAWIRTINTLGIHYIPCIDQVALVGINSIYNTALGVIEDEDRTDLAEYGINIIQNVGGGFRIRNLFTLSTDSAAMFSNGILMRNFIKISAEDSLQTSENYPNSFQRIKADAEAIKNFLYKLWFKGSTNNVPEGETFGQQQLADGSLTTPDDHFEVQADAINNPLTSINAGQRNITVYFTFPTPTGSIQIDVGIILK